MDSLVREAVAEVRQHHSHVDIDALSEVIHHAVASDTRFNSVTVDAVVRKYVERVQSKQRAVAAGGVVPKFGYFLNERSSAKFYGDPTRNHDRHTLQPSRDLRSNHFAATHKKFLEQRRSYINAQKERRQ